MEKVCIQLFSLQLSMNCRVDGTLWFLYGNRFEEKENSEFKPEREREREGGREKEEMFPVHKIWVWITPDISAETLLVWK